MNAKLLVIGASIFALAGMASAQSVPQEAWVGAPIQFASTANRADVTAGYLQSSHASVAPAELRVGPADAPVGAMTRAEAVADLNMWKRAGLSQIAYGDTFDPSAGEFKAQMAAYQRLRNGPEYRAEVQRLQGAHAQASAARQDIGTN
jgi:hypothetical protein